MADSRFFRNQGPFSLSHLVAVTGATVAEGCNMNLPLHDVAPLDRAGPNDVSFFDNAKYLDSFTASKAGACFIRAKHAAVAPKSMTLLVSDDPYYCYALAAQQFYPATATEAGVSEHAYIHPGATLGKNVRVEPGAVIEGGVDIGDHTAIGAHAVIRTGVTIGQNCYVGSGASISHALIGNRVILHPGVHLGQDGFGFAMSKDGHAKIPQLGRVIIEDDVEIGAGTCIDRGTGPDTTIGAGTKIDNLVQIGHNVTIGRHCVIVAQTGIAGSTRIGDGVVLGGQVGISGHVKIGSGARIAAQSGIMGDIPGNAAYGGSPAVPVKEWHRQTVALSKLTRKKSGAAHD